MAKKSMLILTILLSVSCFLIGCSNDDSEQKTQDSAKMDNTSKNSETFSGNESETDSETENKADKQVEKNSSERMVIHQAELQLKVKSLEKTSILIEKKVQKYGGYIVESTVSGEEEEEEEMSGSTTVRIPEQYFQDFLHDAEDEAAKVLSRTITGQDVTEEYVDLESSLKSKRVVEARLLEFMKQAKKTEDLLKISADLAQVQGELEEVTGKMKYLENQTSFATVSLLFIQRGIVVPEVSNKDLDTWDKTKKQFAESANFILAAGSWLIVFIVGNLPILIILAGITVLVLWVMRRRKK